MKKRKKGTAVRHARAPARARAKAAALAPPQRRSASNSSPAGTCVLSADCTVAKSGALKSALLEVLDESTPVTLDIASVQRIDTAGMQLIAAFVRERESHGRKVEWRGSAPAFASAASLLGVASVLRLTERTA
jgi:phospholipid transport system transporter-binding protein